MEKLVGQYGLSIADGGIDPHILIAAIGEHERGTQGGVRDIARAIERQITDGIIDARAQNAATIRLVADGKTVRTEIAGYRESRADGAPGATAQSKAR